MPRTARQALAALLIALHATISLCGPGLHAAPGLGHAGPAGTSRGLDRHLKLTTLAATASEHCPICDYFSQGQLPSPPPTTASNRLVRSFEPVPISSIVPRPPLLSSRSRAPPRGDARIV
jgi:hypothetical protein